MIIRKIHPQEFKRTKELFATAFDVEYGDEKDAMAVYEDVCENPKCREDASPLEKYAAFEDDNTTMMSCLSISHYLMQFDGNKLNMAGIGGVSSLPQYRRRGGIRGCFGKMIPALYEQGVAFSCLYPFSTAYYRKFGYEISAHCTFYDWKLSFIPSWKIGGHCVLVDESNRTTVLSDIKNVYQSWQERYNLMIYNEEWEYRFVTEANPYKKMEYTYLYYKEDGTPAGYLSFHKEKTGEGQLLICTRIVFSDITGLKGLFALVKSFASDYYAIRFKLPDDYEIEPLMEEISFSACKQTRSHLGMVRVINVQKVLESARYIGAGEIAIGIEDEVIAENNGIFKVIFQDGRANFVKKIQEPCMAQITMPINEFSRLIIGVLQTQDIAFCENIRLANSTPDLLSLLGQVFYKKPCFLMEYF